jgi:hypothetical protein
MGQTADELRSQIDEQRRDVSRDLEAIGDRVSPRRMAARRRARMQLAWRDTRDRLMGTDDDMSSSGGDASGGMMGTMQSAASTAMESAAKLPDVTRRQTQGSPLVATAVAFGAGFLLAAVLPSSRAEERMVDRFGNELREGAAGVKQEVSNMAHDVADNLSDDVHQAGRNVAESANHAMGEVKGNAAGGA